ncbi:MAG TPA: class I SAM-dependent methyltransferase [Candidatus Tumulicola sp.]|jgi:predicted O-methyltransferase YrrM
MDVAPRDLELLHPPPHPLLLELERRALDDGVEIASRETGRLLSTLVHAMQASRILEIGTGYGYATLWMAFAQPRMGKIWTIDPDMRRTDVAQSYFKHAGEDDFIEIFNTPAIELLENFPHRNLDVVFVDASPDEHRTYLDRVLPMLKLSGIVVAYDCLGPHPNEFVRYFLGHPDLDATVLPLGKGTGIGARKR